LCAVLYVGLVVLRRAVLPLSTHGGATKHKDSTSDCAQQLPAE
jgi:hypothetical protein